MHGGDSKNHWPSNFTSQSRVVLGVSQFYTVPRIVVIYSSWFMGFIRDTDKNCGYRKWLCERQLQYTVCLPTFQILFTVRNSPFIEIPPRHQSDKISSPVPCSPVRIIIGSHFIDIEEIISYFSASAEKLTNI
ncbi:hypothetical protein J6590_044311 [Homalodisca vitripennis]|nr:hypothetical protein J6590_044311 [Homalodisca vitripennis]